MHKVRASFIEMPMGITVTFMEGNLGLGRYLTFYDERKLLAMIRRAHVTFDEFEMVQKCLRERRPGMIELQLDDRQYTALKASLRRSAPKPRPRISN